MVILTVSIFLVLVIDGDRRELGFVSKFYLQVTGAVGCSWA